MVAKKVKKKTGRPLFDFSPHIEVVRRLAGIQCTDEEIAAAIGCAQDTLARGRKRDPELDEAILVGRANGRMSIRRAQYKRAMSGNAAMLIWLGKQVLGQRDNVKIDGSIGPSVIRVVGEDGDIGEGK